ncbi:MAG TPA: 50S ribosomal protein L18 [Candidatus Azoamicus sp.]
MYIVSACDRRKTKIRKKILNQNKLRLTVYKSNKHIYAQLFLSDGSKVLASMSSLDKKFKEMALNNKLSKIDEAYLVGKLLADILKSKNILSVVFDRSGFKFHGRIKAVADSIKDNGIKC